MARNRMNVTLRQADPAKLPDSLAEGALLLAELERRGLVEAVGEHLKIRRQGGYPGVDVWLALVMFLAGHPNQGFRAFWEVIREHVKQVAALAGRQKLPAPASVSRALDAVEPALLREASPWLLTEAPGVLDVLRHPAVMTYDAHGHAWHVFDLDPTVRTLRHRALPAGDDLPEAERRSRATGAPGHSGRKRGDVQFRRVDVQHAGAGLWVHTHLHQGNGDGAVDLDLALGSVVALVGRLEHPLKRALVRMDGEHGSVPYYAACREKGIPFLTRLNRPKLYEDRDLLERLRTATWYEVPDSGSGPRRAAADIGVLTVQPDPKTRRPDGTPYKAVKVRVVASAFPKNEPAQRGRVLDGWQVELFATDLPADAWPAPDVVAAYFGRSGQENRFAQEDREVGLDRIISYHLPGQELATVTGLFLMNYRIARGFELETPPALPPTPTLRRCRLDERIPKGWPRDPVVAAILCKLDWGGLLQRHPGWTWDREAAELRCPDGRPLVLTTVRREAHARNHVIFCRPSGGCEECGLRESCFCSSRPKAAKHLELAVPEDVADQLRQRLGIARGKIEPRRRAELDVRDVAAGLREVIAPRFLPAAARRRYREIFAAVSVSVTLEQPRPQPPRPRLVARDDADRQQRRQTWSERVAWNALPDGAVVGLEVASDHPDLRRCLTGPPYERVESGGAS